MYEKQVEMGAKWLDNAKPGWFNDINIGTLNLGDYRSCTLGQTFGSMVSKNLCADIGFSIPRGFILSCKYMTKEEGEEHYKILSGTWIREILRRRAMERVMNQATTPTQEPIRAHNQ